MGGGTSGWGESRATVGNTEGKEQKEREAKGSALASSLLRPCSGQETYRSGPRLLLRKRSDVRVTSSVRLQVAWSISLPREAGISAALFQGNEGSMPTATQDSGDSHKPVQPPKHQLLPGQQSPRQPQSLVASTQRALKTQVGRVRFHTPHP